MARRANAAEFIERLPEGYGTFIGERGQALRQPARRAGDRAAVWRHRRYSFSMRVTSNLDTESEQLNPASMGTLLAGRTTFVIAHQTTVRRADLILLMEEGRVIDGGRTRRLMSARGVS